MRRLYCLDGLRGLLATYVLLGHMAPFAAIPYPIAHALSHGGAAVDVFFMLSGLVILRSLESLRYQPVPFLTARIARIYPVYLVMFTAAVAVQAVPVNFAQMPWIGPVSPARDIWSTGWPAHAPAEIGAHLLMLHGVLPQGYLPDAWVSFLGSAWSLSTEWQFYLLAMLLAGRIGAKRLSLALLGVAALGLSWQSVAPDAWTFSRAFLPVRAHYFALGVASGLLLRNPQEGRRWFALVLAGALLLSPLRGGVEKLIAPLVWTVCLGAEAFPAHALMRGVGSMLRTPILLRLGAWSYSIYLANEPVQKLLGVGLAGLAGGHALLFSVLWLPLAAALPVGVAAWLHRRVEVPAWSAGRAWARSVTSGPLVT